MELKKPIWTVPVCGCVHSAAAAAVRASILYRKWLLKQQQQQRSISISSAETSAVEHLSLRVPLPPNHRLTGGGFLPFLCAMGGWGECWQHNHV